MIKKQIIKGKSIISVKSNLTELENLMKEALKSSGQIKQIFETAMDSKGMSFHSGNVIFINSIEINKINENLIININELEFSIAINKECNIMIQIPQFEKCRIFFEDFQMWLSIY